MALTGVGVDIVNIKRMEKALERTPHFAERIFTEEERHYCEHSARPAEHYAARLAVREAVLKALGTGFSQGVGFTDVSLTRDEAGKPKAMLTGKAQKIAEAQGIVEVAVSISFTHEVAVANAVVVTNEAKPRIEEKVSQRDLLKQSFKEARFIIDQLDQAQKESLLQMDDHGEPRL